VCAHTAGFMCSMITTGASQCVCVCVPHQKQRNPNTHLCKSINITGCQSTSNNAAVICDNINTSSCVKPTERRGAKERRVLVLTVEGDSTESAAKPRSEWRFRGKRCRLLFFSERKTNANRCEPVGASVSRWGPEWAGGGQCGSVGASGPARAQPDM